MKKTIKEILGELRALSVSSLERTPLWKYLKYEEYLPQDSEYLRDENREIRAEIVELIGEELIVSDVYILRKLADFEIEYTKKIHYHNCLAEIVFYLYEIGNKEDVIYAYEVRHGVSNMDAASASYDETLTMRTAQNDMMSYLKEQVENSSDFLKKYPHILSYTKWAYDFENHENEDAFMKDFAGYYGLDTSRMKGFNVHL